MNVFLNLMLRKGRDYNTDMVNKILVSFIDSRCYTFELSLSKRKLFKTFF